MNFKDLLPKALPFTSGKIVGEYFFGLNITEGFVEAAVWGVEGTKLVVVSTSTQRYSEAPLSDLGKDLIEASNYALDEALAQFQPEPVKILFGVPDSWMQDDELKPEYLKILRKLVKELDVEPLAFVSTTHALTHMLQKQQGTPPTAIMVEVVDPVAVSVVKAGKIVSTKTQKRTSNLPEDIEKALASVSGVEVLPSRIIVYGPTSTEKYKEELVTYSWMGQLPFLHLPKIETLDPGETLKAVCLAGASELHPETDFRFGKYVASESEEVVQPKRNASVVPTATLALSEEEALMPANYEGGYPSPVEGKLTKFSAPLAALINKLPILHPKKLPKLGILIPAILLVALIAGFVFLPKAKVTIFLDLKVLEKDAQIIADPTLSSVDETGKRIPGKTVEAVVDGSEKLEATGKKKVGDAARGVVVVYNKTTGPKTFPQGTVLIGPDNQRFILDNSVNIASQSAVDGGISFGKANVNATAETIGPEGNLPAGKELTIKDQSTSSFSAKVDSAFSGGVSKDVTIVSADDQKRLLAQLSSNLRKKAKEDIQGKLKDGMKVLEEGLTENITRQTYSKKVGDQASEFTLSLTAKYSGTSYNENDLKLIVSKLVETNVPSGYTLDLTQTETQADVAKVEKDGKLIFAAKFKAKLKPQIDIEKFKKEITFKSPQEVADAARKIENVIGSNIELKPNLPGPFQRLPILPGNISIDVMAK